MADGSASSGAKPIFEKQGSISSVNNLLSRRQMSPFLATLGELHHQMSEETKSKEGHAPAQGANAGQTVAVFTSGGDSCGMNSAVRAVVRMGIYLGCNMYFIREGYQGMVDDKDGDHIVPASWISVSGIIHKGGTEIGSARCKEFREREGRLKAASNLIKYGINNLVVIGGDGSLTGANLFRQEWPDLIQDLVTRGVVTAEKATACSHLRIVGMVGSIDNDFCGTDMTIGTDSALHRILESIDAIVTTASSHQRTFILEVMGRHCGYLALVGALTSEADYVFIPESPPERGWEKRLCDKLLLERELGQRLNIILVAEGAIDMDGKPITAEIVKEVITTHLQQDARITVLGHVQRGGSPSAFDRILGLRMGAEAILALLDSDEKSKAVVVSLDGNQAVRRDLMKCVQATQAVSKAMAEKRFDDAVKLRGRSFERNLAAYRMLAEVSAPKSDNPNGFILAIICIGAPACGMNAAIRSFVRNIIFRGGRVFAINEGIDGLATGQVEQINWGDVNGLTFQAGSVIGTRRTTVEDPAILAKVVENLEKFQIQGLLIVGGFEAFKCTLQMFKGRAKYNALKIPIACIPATISNNVPGTDFSIGADTAVNEITYICDRIRKSAEGTKRRVFIIETMGGYCGYLATLAGLAGGADAAYIHEDYAGIKDIISDVDHMIAKMKEGVSRGLILRNEKSSPHYDTDFLFKLYAEEGKPMYSCRSNILGHMQQGANPSPFDRNLGTKLAAKASEWLMNILAKECKGPTDRPNCDTPETAILLGLIRKQYEFTPIIQLEVLTDFSLRRPKLQWYLKLRPLLKILAKHESTYDTEARDSTTEADEKTATATDL